MVTRNGVGIIGLFPERRLLADGGRVFGTLRLIIVANLQIRISFLLIHARFYIHIPSL